jgi:hypothetical protein
MAMKPTITTGLGALTPSAWKDLVQAVDYVKAQIAVTNGQLGNIRDAPRWITVEIGEATKIESVARWEYAWTQVRRVAAETTYGADALSALTDTTPGMSKALNTLEAGNTEALAYGYAVLEPDGVELQEHEGFEIRPVPEGAVVHLLMTRDTAGILKLEFSAANPIDGTCPEPPQPVTNAYDYGSFLVPDPLAIPYDAETFAAPNETILDFGNFT